MLFSGCISGVLTTGLDLDWDLESLREGWERRTARVTLLHNFLLIAGRLCSQPATFYVNFRILVYEPLFIFVLQSISFGIEEVNHM
jgi:hypothetical protein